MSSIGFTEEYLTSLVHYKVYEDNSGVLDMSREYKYCPIMKCPNVKLHHFRDYVDIGKSLYTRSGLKTNQQITLLNHGIIKPMRSTGRRFKDGNIWTPN